THAFRGQRLHWLTVLVLFLVPVIVFGPSSGFDFTDFDDDTNIIGNAHVTSLSTSNLRWMFTNVEYARRYLPIGWMAYAVDQQFFGLSAFACHFGNVLLHGFNTVLVFWLIRRLLELSITSPAFHKNKVPALIARP